MEIYHKEQMFPSLHHLHLNKNRFAFLLANAANICCIPPHGKTVKITYSLHIDCVELRNDDNFLLEISLVFCQLHINGIGYTIYQG
jgi:hypothetical protein